MMPILRRISYGSSELSHAVVWLLLDEELVPVVASLWSFSISNHDCRDEPRTPISQVDLCDERLSCDEKPENFVRDQSDF